MTNNKHLVIVILLLLIIIISVKLHTCNKGNREQFYQNTPGPLTVEKCSKSMDELINLIESLKAINCPSKFNTAAIDEFLLIFLVAARAKGTSIFKNLSELNQKESPRLIWASKILNKIGIKNIITKSSMKIYGNPNLRTKKKIVIKNFMKDHRVFMASAIAALSFGGKWQIHDKDSIKTSFPNFLKIINDLKK